MFAMQNKPCEFAQYARGLNLSSAKDQNDLAVALNKSFTFICSCAADKLAINGTAVEKLRKIVFDRKAHTLAPQPTNSALLAWLPSKTWSLLGYEEEIAGPKNLEGMMLFIAEKLSKLAKLKFGSADDETFTKYLLVNYTNIRMGITYLKEYYRRFVSSISKEDNEEKTLERCLSMHETITASAALIVGYSSEEFYKLSDSILNISKAHDLLSLEINAPIENMMSLGKKLNNKAYIQEILKKGKHDKFMISCLKIDAELFHEILGPLANTLEQAYENRFSTSNDHLQEFYLQILNSEYFKELHTDVVIQLLETKWKESEEEFQIRCQCKPIKGALNYIFQKIEQIKKQPIPEQKQKEQLTNFLVAFDDQLPQFSPFKKIYNFALAYWNQTSADNNPGLPFKALGSYQIKTFITQVLFSFDDLEEVNLSDTASRKKLLECAEPIITDKFSTALQSTDNSPIDLDKLNHWLTLFPEINQLSCWPLMEKFCKINDIEIPF